MGAPEGIRKHVSKNKRLKLYSSQTSYSMFNSDASEAHKVFLSPRKFHQ